MHCRSRETRRRGRRVAAVAIAAWVVLCRPAVGLTPADLGRPQGHLTDAAGVLSPADAERLETYLAGVASALGVQFAAVLVPSTSPLAIEEFAFRLFELWGVGDAARDEGLLLLVAVQDRKVRFEVGTGLEGALPDGRVGGIIRADITPRFRDGDWAGGVQDGMAAAARFVAEDKGLPAPAGTPARASRRRARPPAQQFLPFFLGLVVLVALASGSRRRRRGPWDGFWLGGPWGGGGFGGGGMGGGFGGFGGGGSGGGFGGFGGGGSRGGGATGGW